MDLKQKIKAEASRLGFSVCGFAAIQPPPHYRAYLSWLEAGNQAGMDYLARPAEKAKRANPSLLMPGAKTILCLAVHYTPMTNPPEPAGRIASYAHCLDYHLLLPPRMDGLVDFLQTACGVETSIRHKALTDSAPLLEREFAGLAGLGWIGRNSNLISPRFGSYLLLGEILLDVELEPDLPFAVDYCGTCKRCVEACPTGCILPDHTIDARRCISYLTIENKGEIPPDLRPLIGEWVFGCDICQQVCPWNRKTDEHPTANLLQTQLWVSNLDIEQDAFLTPQMFNQKFRNSPIKRAKRRGYLRNIAVVLGNRADPSSLPALKQLLVQESEALVRSHAAWGVGQINRMASNRLLVQALQEETEESVRMEIIAALERSS